MATSTTSSPKPFPKKTKYIGRHKVWCRFLDGNCRTFISSKSQDNDPVKLRGFYKRINERIKGRVGIVNLYIDQELEKSWFSDRENRWWTPKENEEYIAARRRQLAEERAAKESQ